VSRDAFVSLLYQAAVRLGTLGLSIAAARMLGSAGAGALGIALQVVGLASLVATFNLPQGLTQHLSRAADPATRQRYLSTAAGLIGGLALVTAAVLMLSAPWIALNVYHDVSLLPVLFACGPMTLAAAAYLWVEGAMQGLRRFGWLARWGAAVAVLDLVIGVIAASSGVVVMLVARSVLRAFAAAFAALRGMRARSDDVRTQAPTPTHGAAARSLLAFAGPTLAAGVVLAMGNTWLRALLVRGADLAAAGHYQAADSIAQAVTLVPLAAAAAFMPAMAAHAGKPDRELAPAFQRAMQQVAGYNVALCLVAVALAPWVMQNVVGRDFAAARPVFVLLVGAYAAVGPSALFGAWLLGRGRTLTILIVNTLWAIVTLVLFRFAFAPLGAFGAGIACMLAYWAALAIYACIVAPRHGMPWGSYLPAVLASALTLAIGIGVQLIPGVPTVIAVGVDVSLALLMFMHWGLPSLRDSGLLARVTR
jgi:O-antigen/teichoic acid export membrane protein